MPTVQLQPGHIRVLEQLGEDSERWQKLPTRETGIAFSLASQGLVEGKLWGNRSNILWHITPLGKARLSRETAKRHVRQSERSMEPNRRLTLVRS